MSKCIIKPESITGKEKGKTASDRVMGWGSWWLRMREEEKHLRLE